MRVALCFHFPAARHSARCPISILYSLFSVLSHSTLYSNLPIFATHLPVIYGKPILFEPLFKTPILILLGPPMPREAEACKASSYTWDGFRSPLSHLNN